MLHFKGFQKKYGSFLALEIDDLHLKPGLYWVTGENGSGKSTFLKTIAGILSFDGDIVLNDLASVKKQPVAYRKLVNFAEAEPIYPGFLTGKEMIRLFASAKGAMEGQEDYFIQSMKMESYIDHPLATYSSGMMKKLSLLLAFLGKPQLILLDEPLITLDSDALIIFYRWIEVKHLQDGVSFFLSSHQELSLDANLLAQKISVEMKTVKLHS